jgi:hypothetical protein
MNDVEEEFSKVHLHYPVWFGLVGRGFGTSTQSDALESTLHVVVLDKDVGKRMKQRVHRTFNAACYCSVTAGGKGTPTPKQDQISAPSHW